jgi:ribokinase
MPFLKILVPGAMCTDITVSGLSGLPTSGEDAYGPKLNIGPGAKSRNIAEMTARLTAKGAVAMLSRTSKDPYGLWNVPYKALQDAGVNTDFVKVMEKGAFPAVALVAVDVNGNRQAAINNTVISGFSKADIDEARPVFEAVGRNSGLLALSFELPYETGLYAMQKAAAENIKIFVDPGGLAVSDDTDLLFKQEIYLLKPNEHEAKQLTGIEIKDMATAEHAAEALRQKGVENVLITHGENGAYLFESDGSNKHIKPPIIKSTGENDATGCGDQVMAALCAYISEGSTLAEAAKLAIAAGTLQFNRPGIQPLSREEVESAAT